MYDICLFVRDVSVYDAVSKIPVVDIASFSGKWCGISH